MNKTIIIFSTLILFLSAYFVVAVSRAEANFNVTYTYKGQTITIGVNTEGPRNRPDVQSAIGALKAEANRLADAGRSGQIITRPSCGNTHRFNIGGGPPPSGEGAPPRGGGAPPRGGGYAPPPPPPQCTQYRTGQWGVCSGFDEETGQNGTQTRNVTSYQGGCPAGGEPSSSQSCSIPFDFTLLKNDGGGDVLVQSSDHLIEVVFVGTNPEPKRSSTAVIGIDPKFSKHPDITDATFDVTTIAPEIPEDAQFIFEPEILSPDQFGAGTEFSVIISRIDPGDYPITVNVGAGGVNKEARITLRVRVVDPSFNEF